MNPYLLTSILFVLLALLGAIDASFVSFNILPWFNGLRWLRIHLITLGVLSEALFGLLPLLVAARTGQPKPRPRLDIWLALNAGILALLVGIPLVNQAIILVGGTLIFIATILLIVQLWALRSANLTKSPCQPSVGRLFYIAGLSYFLLGIIVGTGLWLGWNEVLQMAVPIEVHIHANNWGFLSLLFAGLLVDLYPKFAGRSFAWPRSINLIFWMMTLGALGLVLGPWFQKLYFTVPGLILHLSATIWLLLNIVVPLKGDRKAWTVGMAHLITSYTWILAPVLIAPLILLQVPGFPAVGIEQNAPQALIYGWVLQFGYALLPYLFARVFLAEDPRKPVQLGGNWFSLIMVHLGGIFLWVSIFITAYQNILHGTAYALWALSMLPILTQLWHITRRGLWHCSLWHGQLNKSI